MTLVWAAVTVVVLAGWVWSVVPHRRTQRTDGLLSERAAAARLHPTESRRVRREPGSSTR